MKYNEELNKQFVNSLISKYELNSLENCYYELQKTYFEEGGKTEFSCISPVLNLDCVEKLIGRKENRGLGKTMDISFIVSKNNLNSMVFADFKLNTKVKPSLRGLISDTERKIAHSNTNYSNDYELFKYKYLIYRKEVTPVAESKINRSFHNRKHSLKAIDIVNFHSLFFNA